VLEYFAELQRDLDWWPGISGQKVEGSNPAPNFFLKIINQLLKIKKFGFNI
jgi:hypothetical protein